MSSCGWCTHECGGAGDISYVGPGLIVVEGDHWHVHPFNDGMGGEPFVISPAARAANEITWPDSVPESNGLLSPRMTLEADSHHTSEPVILLELVGPRMASKASQVKVTKVKGSSSFHWEFRVDGAKGAMPCPGGLSQQERDRYARFELWSSGRLSQFRNARREALERAREVDEAAEVARQARWVQQREAFRQNPDADAFVNPYHFVPLGSGATRHAVGSLLGPQQHLALSEDRLSGRMTVSFTALTQLALSGAGTGTPEDPHQPLLSHGRAFLPGSSLAGAVRSMHEALTDSCLRVADMEYAPIHRDVARPRVARDTRVGRIVKRGGALTVELFDQINVGRGYPCVWMPLNHVSQPGGLHTGDRFHIHISHPALVESVGERLVHDHPTRPQPCSYPGCPRDHWTVLVAQAVGRRMNLEQYWVPFAKESVAPVEAALSAEVLETYERAASDSADVRAVRHGAAVNISVPGVGTRQQVTSKLQAGQFHWITLSHGAVTRVTPSVLWRQPGLNSVRDRATGYEPCADPTALCPSCATFGMVEERGTKAVLPGDDAAALHAYRGHVRFGHGHFDRGASESTAAHLVPMGTPRPSAGQFYLNNHGWLGKQAQAGSAPLRLWGSAADSAMPRRIAGRKGWWAPKPGTRHLAQGQVHDTMSSHHKLVKKGTTLTSSMTFDNLTAPQIGALLIAVNPNLLRAPAVRSRLVDVLDPTPDQATQLHDLLTREEGFVTRVGKGKGVGLGVVRPELVGQTCFETWGSERYSADHPAHAMEQRTPVDFVLAYLDALGEEPKHEPEAGGSAVPASRAQRWITWLALCAYDWVPESLLRYPPDDSPSMVFKFDFWQKSTGSPGTVGHGAGAIHPTLSGLGPVLGPDPSTPRPWLGGGH